MFKATLQQDFINTSLKALNNQSSFRMYPYCMQSVGFSDDGVCFQFLSTSRIFSFHHQLCILHHLYYACCLLFIELLDYKVDGRMRCLHSLLQLIMQLLYWSLESLPEVQQLLFVVDSTNYKLSDILNSSQMMS